MAGFRPVATFVELASPLQPQPRQGLATVAHLRALNAAAGAMLPWGQHTRQSYEPIPALQSRVPPMAFLAAILLAADAGGTRIHGNATPRSRSWPTRSPWYRSALRRLLALAYLAPDLVEAIVRGEGTSGVSRERFTMSVPMGWDEQREALGFTAVKSQASAP